MQLDPKHLTLNQLLTGRLFRIPDYQRAYAWGTKQRTDLFSDINKINDTNQSHFMATVVGLARDTRLIGTDDFRTVDVVDGQQRITTLVILLKALEKALSDTNRQEKKAKVEIAELLVKEDDHALILLQTNHDSSSVFSDFIRKGRVKEPSTLTAADRNVLDAIRECEQFVEEWRSDGKLFALMAILKNKLSMIYHELTDEGSVYRVFEVLNSRGLDVRWIDKLKSQLMGLVFQHVDKGSHEEVLREMREIWKDIYRTLGLRGSLGDDALRFAGTLKAADRPNRLLSLEKSAERLSELAGTDAKTIIGIARWLKQVVEAVDRIDKNTRLNAVTRIVHARFLAASIILQEFPEMKENMFLKVWENTTFRIYGLGRKDSRYKVGEYIRGAYDIYRDKLKAKKIDLVLEGIGQGFSISDVMNMADWNNCYEGWTEELRYLLFRFDERLAASAGERMNESQWNKIWIVEPAKSIEHIKPQSSDVSYVHQLGNLTMLPPGINSSLKAKPPKDKADTYMECGIKSTSSVGQSISKSGSWKKTDVDSRTKSIVEFIRKEWA